jgi:hypothetical protein
MVLKISEYVTLSAKRKCHPLTTVPQFTAIARKPKFRGHLRYYSLRDRALNAI